MNNLMVFMQFVCVGVCVSDFLYNIKAYAVGTHLNCIDKLMQFKWVPTTYPFIK